MISGITITRQNSIRIERNHKVLYIDPYEITEDYGDADYIFLTHDHREHLSEDDLRRVIKEDTIIIAPMFIRPILRMYQLPVSQIDYVEPDKKYQLRDVQFSTVPSYNLLKPFHPKSAKWVGYLITFDGITYYVAGDTDLIPELRKVSCDVAFVPIDGTYTMDYMDAAALVNGIQPAFAIPVSCGQKEEEELGEKFRGRVRKGIHCVLPREMK